MASLAEIILKKLREIREAMNARAGVIIPQLIVISDDEDDDDDVIFVKETIVIPDDDDDDDDWLNQPI